MIISSFIIQANVITIVNYNHKTFIVQATGVVLTTLNFLHILQRDPIS
jgi:hypothetical protein